MKKLLLIMLLLALPSVALARNDIQGDSLGTRSVDFTHLTTTCTGTDNKPGLCSPQDDGTAIYCIDCAQSVPCAGGGTGHWALHQGGNWECGGGGTGSIPVNALLKDQTGATLHDLGPSLPVDGTNNLGAFNGVRNKEKNLLDFNASGSTGLGTCTATAGSANLACTALAADFLVPTAVGKFVSVYKAGAAPTLTKPVAIVKPVSTNSGYGGTSFTTYHNGCTVRNGIAYAQAGSHTMVISNSFLYEVGQVITTAAPDSTAYTITSINRDGSQYSVNPVATTTYDGLAVTGADCVHSRSYKVALVESNGAISQFSDIVIDSVASSALNPGDFELIQALWQANGVGMQVCGCEGLSCTPALIGGDKKVQVFNLQNLAGADQILNDGVLPIVSGVKNAPVYATYHDVAHPYGTDIVDGTTCVGNENGTFTGARIVSVSGTAGAYTVILNAAVTNSATGTVLAFDDTPAINSWVTAQKDTNNNMTTGYVPAGAYRIQNLAIANTQGLNVKGDGGPLAGLSSDGRASSTRLIFSGRAFQGSAVYLTQANSPTWDSVSVISQGGSTPAVLLDLDYISGVTPTTRPVFTNSIFSTGAYGVLLANSNTGNVEFGKFDGDFINCSGDAMSDGSYGVYLNSGNALNTEFDRTCIGDGFAGIVNMFAGFHLHDSNFATEGGQMVWSSSYSGTSSTIDASRNEHQARVWYNPAEGGNASNSLLLSNDTFTDVQMLPDCNVIAIGNGATKIDTSRFFGAGLNSGYLVGACPGGFTRPGNPAEAFLASTASLYDVVPLPFANWVTGQFSTVQDYYAGVGNLFTRISAAAGIPSANNLDSGCPYTVANTYGTEQFGSIFSAGGTCNLAAGGGTLVFPVAPVGFNIPVTWEFNLQGTVWCKFASFYSGDHLNGNTALISGHSDNVPQWCSNTKDNLGTFNFYYDSVGSRFVLQNNSGFSSAQVSVRSRTGVD